MKTLIDAWFKRYFSNPDVIILLLIILTGTLVITFMGDTLAPVFAGIVIAYLLDSAVTWLMRYRLPNSLAVWLVFFSFCGGLIWLLFDLLPGLWQQISLLARDLPQMLNRGQTLLMTLPERYPNYINAAHIHAIVTESKTHLTTLAQWILSFSISSITSGIVIIVYLVLVPILVFFFLNDKPLMLSWVKQYLPNDNCMLSQVWGEVNQQLGNYIRGKVLEIIIVSIVTFISFAILKLNYAMLLAVLVGLSVIIPYVGAVLVTIPLVLIAFFQWGFDNDFLVLMITYSVIIAIDANILVPFLFSAVVNLHPVAIIISVLVFGRYWGFWGVFFSIPLATVVKAVLTAWQYSIAKEKV